MNLGQKTMGVCFGRYVNLQILETDYDCFCGCATYCVDLRYYTLLACFFQMHTTQMASFPVKKIHVRNSSCNVRVLLFSDFYTTLK
jgi:hypothetical protein